MTVVTITLLFLLGPWMLPQLDVITYINFIKQNFKSVSFLSCSLYHMLYNCVPHNFKDGRVSLVFSMMLNQFVNKIVMISTILCKQVD